jgi:hypothetical protein
MERLPRVAPSFSPGVAARTDRPIEARVRRRLRGIDNLVHLAMVNDNAPSATLWSAVPGPAYRAPGAGGAIDLLAVETFGGGGPASFYSQTWAAGLAYSNGIRVSPEQGQITYSAERCPDPVATMRLVAGLASSAGAIPPSPAALQASLAQGFSDYRGTAGFSERGAAIAADLADGLTPDRVRAFKTGLLQAAQAPGVAAAVAARRSAIMGQLLVGAGGRVADGPRNLALVIGPQRLLARYERFLKASGETPTLPRIYPRDLWPDETTSQEEAR